MQEGTPRAFLGSCFATPGERGPQRSSHLQGGHETSVSEDRGGIVSLRTEYGRTLRNSVRRSITVRPFRAGFAGSHTLLAHFVRPSSLKGGPKSMARLCRKGRSMARSRSGPAWVKRLLAPEAAAFFDFSAEVACGIATGSPLLI